MTAVLPCCSPRRPVDYYNYTLSDQGKNVFYGTKEDEYSTGWVWGEGGKRRWRVTAAASSERLRILQPPGAHLEGVRSPTAEQASLGLITAAAKLLLPAPSGFLNQGRVWPCSVILLLAAAEQAPGLRYHHAMIL